MTGIKEDLLDRIVRKKIRIDSYGTLHPDLAYQLEKQKRVEYIHSTTALEGNTLTQGETEAAINGETINGKTITEHFEVVNHPKAIDYIEELVAQRLPLKEEHVKQIHRFLMDRLLVIPGDYRTGPTGIGGAHVFPPKSVDVPNRVKELLDWLERNQREYRPIELAARFMHRFLVIHPFQNGNGRTARLLMNLVLMQRGYSVLINISNRDRKLYLNGLREADLGNYEPLLNFIARSVEDSLTKHIVAVEELDVYTLRQAAEHSPYSAEYLGLRARDGFLGAFKDGRNWKVTREALDEYVSRNSGINA